MKNLILVMTALFFVSCGVDVDVSDSHHIVEHRLVLDGNLEMFTAICERQYEDLEDQKSCVDGYLTALDGIILKQDEIK